jgi:BirA family transcriptional regulator, biotin operon repressor / biotin---[acetyl-CoA-carboxylase] ligase
MSLLVRSPPRLLPLQAAVAVAETVGEGAMIKWPNDVVLALPAAPAPGLGKLAGILIEGRPQEGWAVLGIGLNVAVRLEDLPEELRPTDREQRGGPPGRAPASGLPAASMEGEAGDVEMVLASLLAALARRMAESPETTLQAWRERDALRGREIAWAGGSGRADGIDGDGRLVVALAEGGHTAIGSGEVHLERIG